MQNYQYLSQNMHVRMQWRGISSQNANRPKCQFLYDQPTVDFLEEAKCYQMVSCWSLIVNVTQLRVIWEESPATEIVSVRLTSRHAFGGYLDYYWIQDGSGYKNLWVNIKHDFV